MVLQVDYVLPKTVRSFYSDIQWKRTLQYLLGRANLFHQPCLDEKKLYFDLLKMPCPTQVPVAALTGLADRLDTHKHYWVRADPQNLVIEGNQLFAQSICWHDLRLANLNNILYKLQALFSHYSMRLHTPCLERWYLSMPFASDLESQDVEQLQQGVAFEQLLNKKENVQLNIFIPWKKLFTEVQMLLYEAQLSFNSLWFWGNGLLPKQIDFQEVHPIDSFPKKIWSNVPLMQGLSYLKDYPVHHDLSCWEQELKNSSQNQHCLLVFQNQSSEEILSFLQQLVKMLKNHTLDQLRLYDDQGRIYCSTPYTIRRFWRYKIPTI